MRLRCPRCGSVVEGEPGRTLVCRACGFSKAVPARTTVPGVYEGPLETGEGTPLPMRPSQATAQPRSWSPPPSAAYEGPLESVPYQRTEGPRTPASARRPSAPLWKAAATQAQPATPQPEPPEGPKPGASLGLGIGLMVAAAIGLVLDFTSPWVSTSGETLKRGDLSSPFLAPYPSSWTTWPLWGFIGLMVTGAFMVASDLSQKPPGARLATRTFLLAASSVLSLLVALSGLRIVGVWIAAKMSNTNGLGPHVAVYYHLLAGLGLLAASLWFLRGPLAEAAARPPRLGGAAYWGVVAAAVGLCLTPVLPFGSEKAGEALGATSDHQSESDLEALAGSAGDGSSDVEQDLSAAGTSFRVSRQMLWLTLWMGLISVAAGILAAQPGPPGFWSGVSRSFVLAIVPILVGLIAVAIGYSRLFGAEGMSPGFNFFTPLAQLALGAAWIGHLRADVLRPRSHTQGATAAAAATE